jgi:ribose/xylose/arabinose/galactoside ABC-type transport system permease subunit
MYILLACIIVMMAGQVMVSPNIVKSGLSLYSYLVKCILTIESTALIACGVTFVIVCGKNDLSTGFLMQLAASVACVITTKHYGTIGDGALSVLAIIIPLAVGAFVGLVNGVLVAVFDLNAFVTTLGTAYIIQAAHVLFNGGGTVYPKALALFQFIGKGRIAEIISFPIILLIIIFLLWGFVLHKTTLGRKVFAVGGNPVAAKFSGIDSRKIVLLAYIIAGAMAGLAGVFVASYSNSGDMLMGVGKEFDAIIAVVLGGALLTGGAGSILGTALGAIFLGVLNMFYVQFDISISVQWVIRGTLMLVVILANGLLGQQARGGKKE